jgi:hypothetical protein
VFCNPAKGAPITWENLSRPPCFVILVSRGLFGQEACKGLFSLFGCLRHAFKKAGRAFYQPRTTGAIDFPPPGLRRTPSSLHDERIVGRVKFFTHAT